MSKVTEPMIDHSQFGWKRTHNFMGNLSKPDRALRNRGDKDGLTREQRRKIEAIKNEKLYASQSEDPFSDC